MKKNQKSGFTLIELLVVIAIIGILSSVVLASLNSARARARDAARKSDLNALQIALELYYSKCGSYLVSSGCNGTTYGSGGWGWLDYDYGTGSMAKGLVDNGLIGQQAVDPSGQASGPYAFMIGTGTNYYRIWASLENPTTQDTATLTACAGAPGSYNNYMGAAFQNYCVNGP